MWRVIIGVAVGVGVAGVAVGVGVAGVAVGVGVAGVGDGVVGVADGGTGVGVSAGYGSLHATVHFAVGEENALQLPLNALTLNWYDVPHCSPVASAEVRRFPAESVLVQAAKVQTPEPTRL